MDNYDSERNRKKASGKYGKQDKLLPLIDACFTEVNPIPVKAGCDMLGLNAGVPRAPLTELEDAHKKILKDCIHNLGIKI